MIIGANIIKEESTKINEASTWIKLFFLFPLMACIFIVFFVVLEKIRNNSEKKHIDFLNEKKCFLICWMGNFLIWVPSWLSAYPGIYGYDSIYQIKYFVDGNVYTHHPIIHTYLLGFFIIKLGRDFFGSLEVGMMLYSIFQMLCMSAIFSVVYTYYIRKRIQSRWRLLILAWFAFYPVNAILSFSSTKDVLYAGIFMLCMMMVAMVLEQEEILAQRKFCTLFVLSWFGEMIFRNQGKYVFALGIMFLLLAVKKYRKRLFMLTVVIFVILGVYDGPITSAVAYRSGDTFNEMMSVPCVQLSRAMINTDLNEDERSLIEEYIPHYKNYEVFQANADGMKNTFNRTKFKENPCEFIKLWVKVGIEHPVTYIDAFARITIGFWYPDMNYRDENAAHPYWEWLSTGQNDPTRFEGYILLDRKPMKLFEWLSKLNYSLTYENWYQRIPVISMIFSSGLAIWCIFFYMLYMIYYKKYKQLVLIAFPLALWLTLLLGPVVLYRYIYPIVLTIPVMFAFVLNLSLKVRKRFNGR